MFDLEILVYTIIGIIVFFALGTMAFAGYRGAPWVPTKKKDLDRLINLAEIKDGESVYELGSGDGRILFEIAKRFKVSAIGVEISFLPYVYSKIKSQVMNTKIVHKMKGRVLIKYRNLFQQSLNSADLVICFLMPKSITELEAKFSSELKKGAKVISYVFPLKSYVPIAVSKPEKSSIAIYLYQF
ncbi:MAG: class I SAM-dependent methyltransferase [Patescibacteria group bacterium]|jgi:SAM-dependent methyltransferase